MTAVTTAGLLAGLFGSAFVPAAKAEAFDTGLDAILECDRALNTTDCEQSLGNRARISFTDLVSVTTAGDAQGSGALQVDSNANGIETDESTCATTGVTCLLAATDYYIKTTGSDVVRIGNDDTAADGFGGNDDLTIGADLNDADDQGLHLLTDDLANDDAIIEGEVWFEVSRSTAGDVVVALGYYDANGVWVDVQEETVTFTASAGSGKMIDWDSTNTIVGFVTVDGSDNNESHPDCQEGVTTRADTGAANVALASSAAFNYDDTTGTDLCIILWDENGDEIENATRQSYIDVTVTSSSGSIDIGNDGASLNETLDDLDVAATTFEATNDNGAQDGDAVISINPDADASAAKSTITVTIAQDDPAYSVETSRTYTFTVTVAGDLAKIELTNILYSLDDDAAADSIGATDYEASVVAVGTDAAGNVVDMSDSEFDLATNGTNLIVDSTYGTSAKTLKGTSDAASTVVVVDEYVVAADAYVATGEAWISIDCVDAQYEKLTIKLSVENEAEDEIVSDSVVVYCANNLVSSLTLAAGSTAGTYKATALDARGYPVADGEDLTIISSKGSWVDSTIASENGVATFTGVGISGTISVVAEVGGAYEITATLAASASLTKSGTKASADFGVSAANAMVIFSVERKSTGVVSTYYRKANASGVATFTLKRKGSFFVSAVFGDTITNEVTLKK